VGYGWRGGVYGYQTVQSGGEGRLYMVDRDGDLRWNRDAWYQYGDPSWAYETDPPKIGYGWM
jgi:hypothetical protein